MVLRPHLALACSICGWDIIVTKLNATGTALIGSTYIGGSIDDGVHLDSTEIGYGHLKWNYGDDARSEVQVDNLGNVYVAGNTSSNDFPVTPTAISTTYGGGLQDGVAHARSGRPSPLRHRRRRLPTRPSGLVRFFGAGGRRVFI